MPQFCTVSGPNAQIAWVQARSKALEFGLTIELCEMGFDSVFVRLQGGADQVARFVTHFTPGYRLPTQETLVLTRAR